MFSVHPSQYRSRSKNPRSCTAAGACIYFGNDCTAFLYASKNNPSLLLKCWNTEPLAMPNCAAISSTREALYPRSAKCPIAASTIRARFASERGRGFPSRLICVGFARLLVIPSMAQLLPLSLDPRSNARYSTPKPFFNGFFNELSLVSSPRVLLLFDHRSADRASFRDAKSFVE